MTNSPEYAIIRFILIYNNYNKYINIYNKYNNKDSKELFLVVEALQSFMATYARDTNSSELETWFYSLNTNLSKNEKELYSAIFTNIAKSEVSDDVVEGLFSALARKSSLVSLAVVAYEASEGRKDMAEVESAAKSLVEATDKSVSEHVRYVTDDLNEIYNRTVKEQGLRWRLKSLNTSLGSLRKGDFGFVFARPETGKTTFLASECTHMAGQASSPVLWFNNEEQGEKVMLRCYQAALGATLEQLFSSIEQARKRFSNATKDNLKLIDEAILNKREVEEICAAVNPSLIIFDQIDKIGGFAEDRDDLKLGAIYQWARELAKTYCPVIGICQADGTAEGIKWLTMSHVANAKTSKQAEADWILGIGRSNETGYEAVRHFHISKNKLVGDTDCIPERRHDRWDVLIRPEQARYEDLID